MTLTIDRFEGTYAVCEQEDRSLCRILRENLPKDAKEGDVLLSENGRYILDEKATQQARARLDAKRRLLWKK